MNTKILYSFFILLIILIFFSNVIQFYTIAPNVNVEIVPSNFHFSENSVFSWPLPGFHNISSNFGTRIHPVTQKASTHTGIDIPANPGTYIYSVSSGIVTLAEYDGANGYSIHITNNNFEFIYGHVSPNYIVAIGDNIEAGQIIGYVGPKYVDGKLNGSTTGPHLHLGIKKDGIAVNPLNYL